MELPSAKQRPRATQVNYVAKGGNLYAHGYRFHGSAYVINKYLGMTWLWA